MKCLFWSILAYISVAELPDWFLNKECNDTELGESDQALIREVVEKSRKEIIANETRMNSNIRRSVLPLNNSDWLLYLNFVTTPVLNLYCSMFWAVILCYSVQRSSSCHFFFWRYEACGVIVNSRYSKKSWNHASNVSFKFFSWTYCNFQVYLQCLVCRFRNQLTLGLIHCITLISGDENSKTV